MQSRAQLASKDQANVSSSRLAAMGIALVLCALALSACGGGSGSGSGESSDGTVAANPSSTPASSGSTGTTASPQSITLRWTTPLTRADGTPLVGLAGYKILYGTSSGDYSTTINVSDPTATSYQITNLGAGTYFLTMRSYDSNDNESANTPEVSKTLN